MVIHSFIYQEEKKNNKKENNIGKKGKNRKKMPFFLFSSKSYNKSEESLSVWKRWEVQ